MVVSGGVNIYPREAEHVLVSHPHVVDAAVFGIPDDEMGESLMAVVQLDDPGSGQRSRAAGMVPGTPVPLQVPPGVEFIDELPRDPSGKLFKRLLREPYWEGRESRIV